MGLHPPLAVSIAGEQTHPSTVGLGWPCNPAGGRTWVTHSPWMDGDGSLSSVGKDFTPTTVICLHVHKPSHGSMLSVVFHVSLDSKMVKLNVTQRNNLFASTLKFNKSFLKNRLLELISLGICALPLTDLPLVSSCPVPTGHQWARDLAWCLQAQATRGLPAWPASPGQPL